jgi:hypothetical protein
VSYDALGEAWLYCRKTNHHLPVYDHYCFWLWVEVYLDTIKPYLLFHVWLVLLGDFVIPIELAAARKKGGVQARFQDYDKLELT